MGCKHPFLSIVNARSKYNAVQKWLIVSVFFRAVFNSIGSQRDHLAGANVIIQSLLYGAAECRFILNQKLFHALYGSATDWSRFSKGDVPEWLMDVIKIKIHAIVDDLSSYDDAGHNIFAKTGVSSARALWNVCLWSVL